MQQIVSEKYSKCVKPLSPDLNIVEEIFINLVLLILDNKNATNRLVLPSKEIHLLALIKLMLEFELVD